MILNGRIAVISFKQQYKEPLIRTLCGSLEKGKFMVLLLCTVYTSSLGCVHNNVTTWYLAYVSRFNRIHFMSFKLPILIIPLIISVIKHPHFKFYFNQHFLYSCFFLSRNVRILKQNRNLIIWIHIIDILYFRLELTGNANGSKMKV